jgi:hypothetical protein
MSEPTPPPTRPVLASDAEREAVIARLHTAVGEGRLTADEAGERIATVHTARYRAELAGPVADLPVEMGPVAAGAGSGPPSWEVLWAALLWRARVALDGPRTHPTPRRQRVGAVLAGLAVLWTVLWVALGAALA